MPRKMTDTTPLRGIPTPRIPTSGFRSPTSTQGPSNRPNMPRQQAGRKDGGIKILDITEQPLGYAAAKKRKRQQELEEQQKRALEAQSSEEPVKQEPETPVVTTPDYAVGLNATSVYTQPATPAPTIVKEISTNSANDFVKTEAGKHQMRYSQIKLCFVLKSFAIVVQYLLQVPHRPLYKARRKLLAIVSRIRRHQITTI